jgi:FkbM family methyltransferase
MGAGFVGQLSTLLDAATRIAEPVSQGRFIVYGAGGFGRLVGSLIEQAGGEVLFFIDAKSKENFPWPVFQLDEIPAVRDARLIIGIFNAYVDISPVIAFLRKSGFAHILTPVEFFQLVKDYAPPPQYWLAQPDIYLQHRREITECVEYFSDDLSKERYVDIWRYRLRGNAEDLPPHSSTEFQYFPSDVPSWKLPLRFIDCGAYIGDTLHFIRSRNIPIEAIAAFEPDPANYKKLVESVAGQFTSEQIFISPCGVFNACTQLKFSALGEGASAISENGNVTIQCISIDDCLPSFHPTLIKMDIEGAEIEALIGAKKTITRDRPGLAISLYHTPHHIWQIPKLLREWDLGYDFHLRIHHNQGFDTILYALPQ